MAFEVCLEEWGGLSGGHKGGEAESHLRSGSFPASMDPCRAMVGSAGRLMDSTLQASDAKLQSFSQKSVDSHSLEGLSGSYRVARASSVLFPSSSGSVTSG